tara:strand:- start:21377 stop:21979 length:603 start_codon:yes stop_codon:yes gene_type:complete
LVCDVDEVVLHFVRPLETHFGNHGYGFKDQVFKLTGNIRALDGGPDAPDETVFAMIHSYFAVDAHKQFPVEGAVTALNDLAQIADILFLTNMPSEYREARQRCLSGHALDHPVVTNTGPKGPALAYLCERASGPVWFLDDSPLNLVSVAADAPQVELVHFVADPVFLELADHVPTARLRTRCWTETHALIHTELMQAVSN